MKQLLLLASLLFAALTGTAQGSLLKTIDITLTGNSTFDITSYYAHPLHANIELHNLHHQFDDTRDASLVFDRRYDSVNIHGNKYLSIESGHSHHHTSIGFADYDVPGNVHANVFGFTWLNPGSENLGLELFDTHSGNAPFNITFSDIASFICGNKPIDIIIRDPYGDFTSIDFKNLVRNTLLKVANFTFQSQTFGDPGNSAAMPLPGSLILFLTSLVALLVLRRKNAA
jgi:hypothetical protein